MYQNNQRIIKKPFEIAQKVSEGKTKIALALFLAAKGKPGELKSIISMISKIK